MVDPSASIAARSPRPLAESGRSRQSAMWTTRFSRDRRCTTLVINALLPARLRQSTAHLGNIRLLAARGAFVQEVTAFLHLVRFFLVAAATRRRCEREENGCQKRQ